MSVTFVLDSTPPVKVIETYVSLLREISHFEIQVNMKEDTDILIYFCAYPPLSLSIKAQKVFNGFINLTERRTNLLCSNNTFLGMKKPSFPGTYLIRLPYGHGNQSFPERVDSEEQFYAWVERNGSIFLLQKFIDTSISGIFYSARVAKIGSQFYPLYACSSYCWNTNLCAGNIVDLDTSSSCLQMFPHFPLNFWGQILNASCFINIGMMDFSFFQGRLLVWELIPALAFEGIGDAFFSNLSSHYKNIVLSTRSFLQQELSCIHGRY